MRKLNSRKVIVAMALLAVVCLAASAKSGTGADQPVRFKDDVRHAGLVCYRIETRAGTWVYDKRGAGFASLFDADSNDWISYRPKGGSAGNYRGIPNLVHPEGHFHPGGSKCTSKVAERTGQRVTIESQSLDGKWACRWDITADRAVLTVLEAARPYWLLYEGTPGGQRKDGKTKGPLDEADGFCLRPGKGRTGVRQKWDGDVRGDGKVEWVAFGNTRVGRTLLFIHHTDDGAVDSYWPMQHNMTVFGFGRKGLSKHMKKTPDRFTVALIQTADEDEIRSRVAALARFAE